MTVIGGLLKKIFQPEKVIDSVGTILDNLTTSQEEKEAAKLAIAQEINRRMEAMAGLEYADLANAREREVNLKNTIGVYVQNGCAVLVILAFLILLFMAFTQQLPPENKEIAYIMIGTLGTIVIQLYSYWFGSSAGSARKADEIQKLMQK